MYDLVVTLLDGRLDVVVVLVVMRDVSLEVCDRVGGMVRPCARDRLLRRRVEYRARMSPRRVGYVIDRFAIVVLAFAAAAALVTWPIWSGVLER